jgi:hypothetical protein
MAGIIKSDTIDSLRGTVNKDGRRFYRTIIVGGCTRDKTARFTDAFTAAGVNIGDAWDRYGALGINAYCTSYDFGPGPSSGDVRIDYTYESFPESVSVEVGTVEMQEETCYDGSGTLVTTTYNGKTYPLKFIRNYSNVERIVRWSQFASAAQVATTMGFANCTDSTRYWLCRSVNAIASNVIYGGDGLYLFTVRMEFKIDQHKTWTWLEDRSGYIIQSTITGVYPYPTASFPTGWL